MSVFYDDVQMDQLTARNTKVFKLMQSLSRYLWLNITTEITVWLTSYSNTVVYGENEYGESSHLSIFTLLKHLMMLLKYKFSGLYFYTLPKTLIVCRAMQLRFFKVETTGVDFSAVLLLWGGDLFIIPPNNKRNTEKSAPEVETLLKNAFN